MPLIGVRFFFFLSFFPPSPTFLHLCNLFKEKSVQTRRDPSGPTWPRRVAVRLHQHPQINKSRAEHRSRPEMASVAVVWRSVQPCVRLVGGKHTRFTVTTTKEKILLVSERKQEVIRKYREIKIYWEPSLNRPSF